MTHIDLRPSHPVCNTRHMHTNTTTMPIRPRHRLPTLDPDDAREMAADDAHRDGWRRPAKRTVDQIRADIAAMTQRSYREIYDRDTNPCAYQDSFGLDTSCGCGREGCEP